MKPVSVSKPAFLLPFLLENVADSNRTRIKQMLKFGSIKVNGRVTTSHSHTLKPGDTVEFLGKRAAKAERARKDARIDIVYEDDEIIVINKAPGLLTMANEKERSRTLYFELTSYERSKSPDGKGRVFIVHRLDRDTSGLIVFAKNPKAKAFLQKNWPQVEKKYQAVVEGKPSRENGSIRSSLVEDKFKRVYKSSSEEARDSVTHYRTVSSNGEYSLLEVTLETGRKNQIRVHLADLGHPVAGDEKYGAHSDPLGRLALHSYYLAFPHPSLNKRMAFERKASDEFNRLAS
jgi:23S rRNA pseudouridine1911/1915/1917 synthase